MREAIKKYRILLGIEILLLFLLLPGCFQKERLVFQEADLRFGNETGISAYEGSRFQMKPGVYQVRINVEEQQEGTLVVDVNCDQGSFRAVRCNGVPIISGRNYVDFEVYVLENVDSGYVSCSFSGTKTCISSLEVYRVNLGFRLITFIYALGCLLLDFLLIFRDGIMAGKVKKESQVVFFGLLFSTFIAYFPYMTDYFSSAADIAFHWLRIEGLKETLMQGNQFPVRVQSYWLYDHGYAVSSFYGDFFLMIPVLFRMIGFSLMSSYKMFVFVVMSATAVISYYSFKQCTKHTYAALFGSIIYMLAPYRIYNFYNRGAVGEYLAMTFLPLVICGMYRLYTEDVNDKNYSKAKIPLIIGLSCILQSHILSCEMTVIFMLAVCLVFYKKTFRKQTLIQLVWAAVFCLLINVWFWLPLLQMMTNDSYSLSTIISKDIQYMGTWFAELFQLYPNKGTAQSGMYMAEPFQMGIASFLMLLVVLIVLVRRLIEKKDKQYQNPYDRVVLFWAVMILISWYMSTRYFPWDFISKLPLIKFLATALQFPTRLMSVVSVFSAVAAAFFFLWFERECKEGIVQKSVAEMLQKGSISVLLILAIGSAIYHVNDIAYKSSPIWLYNGENMGTISVVNGEYMLEGTRVDDYSYHDPVAEDGLKLLEYEKKGTAIDLYVHNTTEDELFMELPLIGYKGYALKCDEGQVLPYITEERGAHGDLRIAVPAGYEGVVKVSYTGFISFRIAELVSAMTMICIVIVWMSRRRLLWKAKAVQLSKK